MADVIHRLIKNEMEKIEINQELIKRFTGKKSSMAKLIVLNSQDSINQSKESIEFFSKL